MRDRRGPNLIRVARSSGRQSLCVSVFICTPVDSKIPFENMIEISVIKLVTATLLCAPYAPLIRRARETAGWFAYSSSIRRQHTRLVETVP